MILDFPSHNLIVWWNAVLRPCVLQFGNLSTGIPWSVLWLLRTKIREPFGLSQIFCLLVKRWRIVHLSFSHLVVFSYLWMDISSPFERNLISSQIFSVCKLWTQEPENFDEEVMSLVTAWWIQEPMIQESDCEDLWCTICLWRHKTYGLSGVLGITGILLIPLISILRDSFSCQYTFDLPDP